MSSYQQYIVNFFTTQSAYSLRTSVVLINNIPIIFVDYKKFFNSLTILHKTLCSPHRTIVYIKMLVRKIFLNEEEEIVFKHSNINLYINSL